MLDKIISFVWLCGILKLITLVIRLLQLVRRQLRTTDHLTERYGRGSWAIITGASDGIGLEMAKELARKSFNIVLIARNPTKLETCAKQII